MTGPEIIEAILADTDEDRRRQRLIELDKVIRPGGVLTWQAGYDPLNIEAGASLDLILRYRTELAKVLMAL